MSADWIIDYLPNGRLSVRFPYDPFALPVIRAVDGRRWHKEQKFWSIPIVSLRMLQQEAGRNGISLALSERVRDALALGDRRRGELETAKTDESELELPTETTPYPFQYSGVRFLRHALRNFRGALNADDMGLGKTFQSLSVVATSKVRSVLIVVPNSLKFTWAHEIERHYPQLTYTVIGGTPEQRKQQWGEETCCKIVNYELIRTEIAPRAIEWDLVIADEVVRIENYKTQTAKVMKKLRRKYSLGLSGIPIENRLEELHSIMDWIMPGVLGPGWLFMENHAVRDRWGNLVGYKGVEIVRERIKPYMIRRTKGEVLKELPPKVNTDVDIQLSREERKIYNSIRLQIVDEIRDNTKLRAQNILTMMLRLKQASDDYHLLDEDDPQNTTGKRSSKMVAVTDIEQTARDNERQVVFFSQFSQMADRVARALDCPIIKGGVKTADRQRIIDDFQAGKHTALVSTDAGAYGITLTAADVVVHIDQPWNPARLRQREDRLHRIGQERSVQVVTLMAQDTIDEYVRSVLNEKQGLINLVMEEGDELEGLKLTKHDLLRMLGEEDEAA